MERVALKMVQERMLNKVKNNSKSGLRMRQIISSVIVIMVISSNLQLFIFAKEQDKTDNEKQIQINEEQKIADNYERKIDTTSRSMESRKSEETEEQKVQYKKIEEITISKKMDLSKRCGISKEDFKKLIKNVKQDTSGFFYKNSDLIYDLCEKYEINEIFFCGLIAAESGWDIAKSHRVKCNYISMMSKGKMIKYSSTKAGLEAAAKLLHKNYLTPGGSCYNGKTLAGVKKMFCPKSSTWVGLVYECMEQIVK